MIFDNGWLRVIIGENFCMDVTSLHLRKEQTIIFDIRWLIVNISLIYRITFCKQSFLCFIIHISRYNFFADITFEQRDIGNDFGYIVQKNLNYWFLFRRNYSYVVIRAAFHF